MTDLTPTQEHPAVRELRGWWWRLNDPVLRQAIPERPGERAAAMDRAKALGVQLAESAGGARTG